MRSHDACVGVLLARRCAAQLVDEVVLHRFLPHADAFWRTAARKYGRSRGAPAEGRIVVPVAAVKGDVGPLWSLFHRILSSERQEGAADRLRQRHRHLEAVYAKLAAASTRGPTDGLLDVDGVLGPERTVMIPSAAECRPGADFASLCGPTRRKGIVQQSTGPDSVDVSVFEPVGGDGGGRVSWAPVPSLQPAHVATGTFWRLYKQVHAHHAACVRVSAPVLCGV